MFPIDSVTDLESRLLRSEKRFRSDKRRKNLLGRGSYITNKEEGYEIASYLDEGSCDEEEEYQPIFEGDEHSEYSTEATEWEHGYKLPTTLHISLEVRSIDLSPSTSVNTSSTKRTRKSN